jgi:hypothetical protein
MAAFRLALVLGLLSICLPVSASVISAPIDGVTSYTVQQIMDAGGVKIGDKTFTEWRVTSTTQGNGLAPQAGAISVTAVQIGGEYGMRFNGPWSAATGDLADTTIGFRVTADDPWLISDNTLAVTAFGADKGGMASISENVFSADPTKTFSTPVANKYVYYINDANFKAVDHKVFVQALKDVWVVKDVVVNGSSAAGASAHVSEFYQTFSQVPEPATLSLLIAGAVVLVARRRHK